MERPARGRVGLHFEIRDNGIGMSEEFLATIFEPFNREQNTTISGIQGTGLGMAITKNLVELMGGNISVESRLGEGTCFFLDLELRAAEEDENLRFWRQSGIRRILAVDDEEEFCLSVRELLSETGVEIRYTTGGREAVRAVEYALCTGRQYQVILIGWRMPEIDGLETARRIREKTGEDTLILLSAAHGWSEIEAEAKKAGVDAFLPKPFLESDLRQTIQKTGKNVDRKGSVVPNEDVLRGKRFLVAEDNEINAEILCELMSIEGAKCEVAVNGQQALDYFLRSEPGYYDAVLMDIQMPVMDGYTAAGKIRACGHPDAAVIPIAAMTANAFAEDVQNALSAGMDAHIAKPADPEILRETLKKLEKERRHEK